MSRASTSPKTAAPSLGSRPPRCSRKTPTKPLTSTRDLASATTTLIGRTAAGAPLEDGLARGALDADAGCVAMQIGGTGEFGNGPVLSPGMPGSAPSPDFQTVILRALKPWCLPNPPLAPGPLLAEIEAKFD